MHREKLKLLRNVPVFGGIDQDALIFLLERTPVVCVPKGEFFFHEGDTGPSMYVLVSGKVAALKTWKGHDYLLRELGVGDSFGEMALLDFCPRSASVLALEDCTAIELATAALHELYNKDIKHFTMIHMNIAREVSRKLRLADEEMFQSRVEATVERGQYVFHAI